ncbi:unnamed protein product [Acanthoscelides obtectus]|uniref:Uncharacterized protein n=1 Tax=Acanthoscelides obtectus TaxID=200917 RepID=A0A9P0NTE0_ACAOB|nr:unnamed protein product [Acanthoscelides obtectus]CAK1672788.1 hypothetical protein AOBTE_LOCUS29087 [Acanthoscelides obtectus]
MDSEDVNIAQNIHTTIYHTSKQARIFRRVHMLSPYRTTAECRLMSRRP